MFLATSTSLHCFYPFAPLRSLSYLLLCLMHATGSGEKHASHAMPAPVLVCSLFDAPRARVLPSVPSAHRRAHFGVCLRSTVCGNWPSN